MLFFEISLRSHVAYGKFAGGSNRDCASLLVVGWWCKLCESDSDYLRMLPSPPPARDVKRFSRANMEDPDDLLYSLLGVERQGADHKRRLFRPVLRICASS